jgi:TonB-linked SusC/RagA family outer membrane protein
MNFRLLRTLKGIVILSLLFCASSYAQVKKITGKVTDGSDGGPMPGVNVSIKGKPSNVATNADGIYTIQADPAVDALVFSYIGFKRQTINLEGRATLNVALASDNAALDEVIVVGYGTKKKSEILGSVATISGEELMDIPAPNIAGALRNRIAGVGVSQVSGRPGSGISLNIRNNTVSENVVGVGTTEPLYVIDGITVDKAAFDNIDPSMVENISFLKDASAAIYGASGAKGVVLITTKRGKSGKISVNYNGYVGVSDAAKKPEMLSAYDHAVLLNETNKINNAASTTYFSPSDLEYIKGLNYKSWYDELWQSATTQRHNLSISGGSDKITFFAGGSYSNENANYAGLQYDKYSFRSGLVATMAKGLKADVAFNVDHSLRLANHNATDADATFFETILTIPQWIPIQIDGKPVNIGSIRNPLGIIESGYYDRNKSRSYRINASLSYEPEFIKGFTARVQVSQSSGNANTRQYSAPYNLNNFATTGSNNQFYTNQLAANPITEIVNAANARVTPGLSEANSYQGFVTLKYTRTFGQHSIDAIVGGEQTVSNSENLSVYWTGQLIPDSEDWWGYNPTSITRNRSNITEATKRSFFSRFAYDYKKRYFVEGSARLDASSNFARGNRWGLSPSLGLGWIISNEDFFKDNISFVNQLKLKVNYGIAGDDRTGEFPRIWQERFTVDTSNGYLFGNLNGNGLNAAAFANPIITWEKKKTFNAGIEATMFDNKLDISVEFFRNKIYDGFDKGADDLYPLYAGFTAPVVNYREAYSWGSEFTIGYKAKLATDLNLSASMNFGYGNTVTDKVIYSPGRLIENSVGNSDLLLFGTDPNTYNSSNFGLISKGMFRTQAEVESFISQNPNYRLYNRIPEVGWLYYEDTNGDGLITDLDMVPMFKRTNGFFASGINLNLGYKSFSLSTSINARLGGHVFYDSRARTAPSQTRNVLSIWTDRWTPDNTNGKYPRYDDPTIGKNSDFWEVDGTTIRINNMTLSYRIPANLANRIGMNSLRLLLTGNNLWTLVNPLPYKDPYTSSAYDYPMLRTISAGLSANF